MSGDSYLSNIRGDTDMQSGDVSITQDPARRQQFDYEGILTKQEIVY